MALNLLQCKVSDSLTIRSDNRTEKWRHEEWRWWRRKVPEERVDLVIWEEDETWVLKVGVQEEGGEYERVAKHSPMVQ